MSPPEAAASTPGRPSRSRDVEPAGGKFAPPQGEKGRKHPFSNICPAAEPIFPFPALPGLPLFARKPPT